MGVLADAVSGFARGGLAKGVFCYNYAWPAQFTCSFAKYGVEAAHQLCREYCRRGHHFYSLWSTQPEDAYQFTKQDCDDYAESLEWITFLTDCPSESEAFARGVELRTLIPTNPSPDALFY